MDMQHVSLAALLRDARDYDQMPIFFQQTLRLSVWITLITEIVFLIVFIVIPHDALNFRVSKGGFIILGGDIINNIIIFFIKFYLIFL